MKLILSITLLLNTLLCFSQDTLKPFSEANKWGYKNSKGVVINCKYDQANEFKEGFASVKLMGRWGFIDQTGKEITPFKYDPHYDGKKDYAFYYFSEGLCLVSIAGKYGFINTSGKEIIPLIYSYGESFEGGSALMTTMANKRIVIDHTGKNILKKNYDFVFGFKCGRSQVQFKNMSGYINRKGDEVIPLKFKYSDEFFEGYTWVTTDTINYYYIDTSGKELSSERYQWTGHFTNGMAEVERDKKKGYINLKGELAIPMIYEFASRFENERALVKKDGKYAIIDKTGKSITPFKYDLDEDIFAFMFHVFPADVIALKFNGKFGYVNAKTGKEITTFKYERAWPFSPYGEGGRAFYKGKWWVIDQKGKETLDKNQ